MTVEHTDVGAYALGLLEDDDRRAFEEHLTGCPACAAEMNGFSGIKDLLIGLGPIEQGTEQGIGQGIGHGAAPATPAASGDGAGGWPPGGVIDLMRRRQRTARRRRRRSYLLGAAAAGVLLAAGIGIGVAVGDDRPGHGSPASDLLAWGELHSATDPRTGAVGTVALEKKAWGTHVAMELRNIRGPMSCRLMVVTRSAGAQPVTSWAVPREGYGVPGAPRALQVHGGAQAQHEDIVRFDVVVDGGGTLVSIPI